jgi:outer membrane lipoprotein carrier protein
VFGVVTALFVGVASATAEAPATDACVAAAVAAVQQRYEAISDLSARFEQRSRSVALGGGAAAETVSRGTVVFAKPGKMRWSYEEPEPSLVVSDGETLWLYDPTRAEVQRLSVSAGFVSGAAIQFLLGQGDMRRDFEVSALRCGPDAAELELVPRADATYEKLQILADLPSGQLRRTTVFDLLGNVTEVGFGDVRTNQSPGDDAFRFDPPEGVEVIEFDVP